MINPKKQKHTAIGVEMLRALALQGRRIFTLDDARQIAATVGIDPRYILEALTHLKRQGWIEGLKRELYAFTSQSGLFAPPHEYEIAQALVPGSVISYWTAMRHYGVTQQVPRIVYSMVATGASLPRRMVKSHFRFVQVKAEHIFGIQSVWINESKVQFTDLERTLLEGLCHPEHCGGFQEVFAGFKEALDLLNYEKITDYALRLGTVIAKRLGWVLEQLDVPESVLIPLQQCLMKGPRKLDASAAAGGKYNGKWQLQENI